VRIAVVGAGAIGGALGGALALAGHDVSLVARGAHLEALQDRGLRLVGPDREDVVRVQATDDPAQIGAVDAVLLTVKAHAQAEAGRMLAPLLGPETPVVAAQNGVPWWYFHAHGGEYDGRRIEAVDPGGALSQAIPPHRAIGLVAYIGATVPEPGVVHVRPEAGLVLGEPGGSDSERLRAITGALDGAGLNARTRPDLRVEIWTKLMGNATFNPISVLTRAGLGTIASHPGTRAVVAAGMRELVAVATVLGAAPTIDIEARLAITARLGEHKTSTLQDLEAGRTLELDAIIGATVELAELTETDAPVLRMLWALGSLAAGRGHTPACVQAGV